MTPGQIPPRGSRGDSTAAAGNLLLDYWHVLPDVVDLIVDDPQPRLAAQAFSPGFALPDLDDQIRQYLSPAQARWLQLGSYNACDLAVLDLGGNPSTHTTKTFASLVIVARAIEFTRRSGNGVYLISPTSGNKGTALRDAVLRAYDAKLATPETLRVAILAPHSCLTKLRASRLSDDAELRRLNPLMVHPGDADEDVKGLVLAFAQQHSQDVLDRTGLYPWFSLDLHNYLIADTTRAFFEADVSPARSGRTHAHAVSSAFGLLGYHQGRRLLEIGRRADPADRPASLLVQHLGTPDMVLHLLSGTFDRAVIPVYSGNVAGGWRQDASPHFPRLTDAPDESIDRTFYTHRPTTAAAMDAVIAEHGGTGIVVSKRECESRYRMIRDLAQAADYDLPADPGSLREWSFVMAMTGTLNALDRGLLPDVSDVVIHASGSYSAADFDTPAEDDVVLVYTVDDLVDVVM